MKTLLLPVLLLAPACGDDPDVPDEQEVITTVILSFQPVGGAPLTFEFDDPDGDGGDPPIIDDIVLPAGTYTLAVGFENRLEDPPEDITEEIGDEADAHLVLFTGTAVVGPATDNLSGPLVHDYADLDANGLPIGLENQITASEGTGQLTVTLLHMPPEMPPGKAADSVDLVRDGGIAAAGGSTDAQVTFEVTVTSGT
jgi:hypothetical protein